MADFMLEPSKFAKDIWTKELEAGLGERRLGLEERKFALEEEKLPWLIGQMGRRAEQAPATVTGVGERGEKILYQWNPEERKFQEISRGATPVSVGKEGKLVSPTTGEVLYQSAEGPGVGLKESFAKMTFKSYLDEMKQIAKEYERDEMGITDPKKREKMLTERGKKETKAREKLAEQMGEFGYKDFFGKGVAKEGRTAVPGIAGPSYVPSLEDFINRVAPLYPKATREQIEKEYQKRYGAK